jgi:hypothetical protein
MAGATPTKKEFLALIAMLQAQVAMLTAAALVAAAAQPAGTAPMIFADMPQTLGAYDLINYLTKGGLAIFEQGCKALDNKALTNGFAMTPNQIVIFVETIHHRIVAPILNNDRLYIMGPGEYLEPCLFILDSWGFIMYNSQLEIMGSGKYLKLRLYIG